VLQKPSHPGNKQTKQVLIWLASPEIKNYILFYFNFEHCRHFEQASSHKIFPDCILF